MMTINKRNTSGNLISLHAAFLWTATILLFIIPAQLRVANFPADDSYFYMQVASNLVAGHGSTFNQITTTNGYHPLWMLFCVFATVISGGSKAVTIHVIFLIANILSLGIAFFFFRISKALEIEHWLVALPLLAVYFLTGLYGSEAHVNGFMLSGAFYFLVRALQEDQSKNWMLASLFMGLAVLARLDNIFVAGCFMAYGCFKNIKFRIRHLLSLKGSIAVLKLVAPFMAIVVPYLLFNLSNYGHMMPISGAIKSSFPVPSFNPAFLGTLGKFVTLLAFAGIFLSFVKGLNARSRMVLRILAAGVILHSTYIVLFSLRNWTSWSWYYVTGVLHAAFFISIMFDQLSRFFVARKFLDKRLIQKAVYALLGLGLLIGASRGWMRFYNPDASGSLSTTFSAKQNEYRWAIELGMWMKDNLPENSRILTHDCAGQIAWYSDHQILPVDGLINDYQYNNELLAEGAATYLAKREVDLYLGPISGSQNAVEIISPLYRKSAGSIALEKSNLIVRVRNVVKHPNAKEWGIWRLGSEATN